MVKDTITRYIVFCDNIKEVKDLKRSLKIKSSVINWYIKNTSEYRTPCYFRLNADLQLVGHQGVEFFIGDPNDDGYLETDLSTKEDLIEYLGPDKKLIVNPEDYPEFFI